MYLRKRFDSYDHSFCEAKLWNGPPEYINSITSLFITLIGIYGLKNNKHLNNEIFMLYSALVINGIASALYHWTNYLGWGYVDRFSMILIAIPSVFGGFKELAYLYKFNSKLNKVLITIVQLYFTLIITFCALDYEQVFNMMFGFFLGFILFFVIMVNNKKQIMDDKVKILINYGFIGVTMIIIAGISWIVIENLCESYWIMKYTHGHALWHIFVSYGGYLVSLLITGLSISRKGLLPSYQIKTNNKNDSVVGYLMCGLELFWFNKKDMLPYYIKSNKKTE